MKTKRRVLAFLLSVFVMASALAAGASDSLIARSDSLPSSGADTKTEAPLASSDAEAQRKSEITPYVGRLKAAEKDLHTFVYANADGTHTMRVYSHPVKYLDEEGDVRDISLDIARDEAGRLASVDHPVRVRFEGSLSDGVSVSRDDINVRMIPLEAADAKAAKTAQSDGDRVAYAIDDRTVYEYRLTYSGVKEDIVVSEYTGKTEYRFRLLTNGLTPVLRDGGYCLVDDNKQIKATIGDIIVFTADDRNNTMGALSCSTVVEGQEYLLTIHLDGDYLRDEKTTYPIRIDPTLEVNYATNGAGAIEDITLNSLDSSVGTSGSLFVGLRQVYGISRVLMRFPYLTSYLDIIGFSGNLESAHVEIRDLLCQSNQNMTIECRVYNKTAPAWSESANSSWNDVGSAYVGDLLDSKLVTLSGGNVADDAQRYRFDITDLACEWLDGTEDPAKGIVFKAQSTFENQTGSAINYWNKTFSSFNRDVYQPSLTLTYRTQIVLNEYEVELDVGESYQLEVDSYAPTVYTLRWESLNTRIATVNATTGVVTAHAPGEIGIKVYFAEMPSIYNTVYVTVKPTATPTSGIVSGSVYMIKNVSKGSYLKALTSTSVGLAARDPMDGKQLWYVMRNGDGYRLYSMGIKDMASYGQNETALGGAANNVSPTVQAVSNWYGTWHIAKNGTAYYLTNSNLNTSSLSANAASSDTTVKCISLTEETTYARWSFEKIESSTFNNYWDGTYNGQGSTVHVKVEIDSSVYTNNIIRPSHFDAIDCWKNVSSKVVIYGPNDTVPSGVTPFVVTFYGTDRYKETSVAGETIGFTRLFGSEWDTHIWSDWTHAKIYLNTFLDINDGEIKASPFVLYYDYDTGICYSDDDNIVKTIAHEVGHALKLAHPKQVEYLPEIDNARGGYVNDSCVCAIMNQDSVMSWNILSCITPKWHDIINLRNKWGY